MKTFATWRKRIRPRKTETPSASFRRSQAAVSNFVISSRARPLPLRAPLRGEISLRTLFSHAESIFEGVEKHNGHNRTAPDRRKTTPEPFQSRNPALYPPSHPTT